MNINVTQLQIITDFFSHAGLLPAKAEQFLLEVAGENFALQEQLSAAESIHVHIKVASVDALPHNAIVKRGGRPENSKEGYIKYAFPGGLNFIFSSIPVSEEENAGIASFSFPHFDHIGIDIRDENEEAFEIFNKIPVIASSRAWPVRKQGGDGKKVFCCHLQVNEKFWVYPPGRPYWEIAFGQLTVSDDGFGCDLRPADPSIAMPEKNEASCCGIAATTGESKKPLTVEENTLVSLRYIMKNSKGEVLEDIIKGTPVIYLHGSGGIMPLLEEKLTGLCLGEEKTIKISEEEGLSGLDDSFSFEVVIDDIRMATQEEITQQSLRNKTAEDCGPDCCC